MVQPVTKNEGSDKHMLPAHVDSLNIMWNHNKDQKFQT